MDPLWLEPQIFPLNSQREEAAPQPPSVVQTASIHLPLSPQKESGGGKRSLSYQNRLANCVQLRDDLQPSKEGQGKKRQGLLRQWKPEYLVRHICIPLTNDFLKKFTNDVGLSLRSITNIMRTYSTTLKGMTLEVNLLKDLFPLLCLSKKVDLLFSSFSLP